MIILLAILFVHWFADFVCQSNWMAQNKSKNINALLNHIFVYGAILTIFALIWGTFTNLGFVFPIMWVAINTVAHGVIDYITSRITSMLWSKKDVHNFFVVIGFDQFLHVGLLLYTAATLMEMRM